MYSFILFSDRTAECETIYIALNSSGCQVSDCLEVPVYEILFEVSDVSNNSIRVGLDVYEMSSPLLTEDSIVDSIKSGGNQLYFKLGDNWYDLLDDKCVSSDWLVSDNSLTINEIDSMLWSKYYRNGATVPVYFK